MNSRLLLASVVLAAWDFRPTEEEVDLYEKCRAFVSRILEDQGNNKADMQTTLSVLEQQGCMRLPPYRDQFYRFAEHGSVEDKIEVLKYGNRECDGDGNILVFGNKTELGPMEPDEVIHQDLCSLVGGLSYREDSVRIFKTLLTDDNACHELYEWCSHIGKTEEYQKRSADKRLLYEALLNSDFKSIKKDALLMLQEVADKTDIDPLEKALKALNGPHEVRLRNGIRILLKKLGTNVELERWDNIDADPYWNKIVERSESRRREAGNDKERRTLRHEPPKKDAKQANAGNLKQDDKTVGDKDTKGDTDSCGVLPMMIGVVVIVVSVLVGYVLVSRR